MPSASLKPVVTIVYDGLLFRLLPRSLVAYFLADSWEREWEGVSVLSRPLGRAASSDDRKPIYAHIDRFWYTPEPCASRYHHKRRGFPCLIIVSLATVAMSEDRLSTPDYHRRPSDPEWLARVVPFHSHLGPAVIARKIVGLEESEVAGVEVIAETTSK